MRNRRRERVLVVLVVMVSSIPLIWFFFTENKRSVVQWGHPVQFHLSKSLPGPSDDEVEDVVEVKRLKSSTGRPKVLERRVEGRFVVGNDGESLGPSLEQQQPEDNRETKDGGRPYEELHRLLDQMEGDWHFWWIRKRIRQLWSEFESVGLKLNDGCRTDRMAKRTRVLILPGVLDLTNFARPETIRRGGPLGELMQWADLIAGSHALCHEVAVRTQFQSTIAQLRADIADDEDESKRSKNETKGCRGSVNFIYTDISGFKSLPADVTNAYRNKFRIADAFGTEAAYNDPEYAASHGIANDRWGMMGLRLKQFYTLYPHSPDNSFLGFVVSRSKLLINSTKENYALIMGKDASYLKGKMNLLTAINDYFPLRATMGGQAWRWLPTGAEAIGIVESSRYQELLRNAKVCVGLGDPVESPGVLEAIAQGCVFLNPRRKGTRMMLKGKPTGRLVGSQVPYLEEYVGPPYVYTIDDDDEEELKHILQAIRKQKSKSFLPYEFSVEGFLRRLHAYTEHQDLCHRSPEESLWPPISAIRIEIAPKKTSCTKACFNKKLVCEPVFFPILNSPEYFHNATNLTCSKIQFDAEIHSPAVLTATDTCSFQRREQLFSCAGGESDNHRRICPCRDFQPFQLAFCKQCTSV